MKKSESLQAWKFLGTSVAFASALFANQWTVRVADSHILAAF